MQNVGLVLDIYGDFNDALFEISYNSFKNTQLYHKQVTSIDNINHCEQITAQSSLAQFSIYEVSSMNYLQYVNLLNMR